MLDFNNNESLLGTNPDGSISYSKTYYVMGQYSRYVRAGYRRFSALTDNSTLHVSAYKDPATGKFTVVVINPGEHDICCKFNLPGAAGSMTAYLTANSSSVPWQQSEVPQTDGRYEARVPRLSVMTFTGVKL
jgi:O-glycosyl hydrolase